MVTSLLAPPTGVIVTSPLNNGLDLLFSVDALIPAVKFLKNGNDGVSFDAAEVETDALRSVETAVAADTFEESEASGLRIGG